MQSLQQNEFINYLRGEEQIWGNLKYTDVRTEQSKRILVPIDAIESITITQPTVLSTNIAKYWTNLRNQNLSIDSEASSPIYHSNKNEKVTLPIDLI